MKQNIATAVRMQTWIAAALFLILFCWLRAVSTKAGALFEGLNITLPKATRLAFDYGPIAFPVFGFIAAIGLILSDLRIRKRFVQPIMIVAFIVVIVWALHAMLIGGSFMGAPIQDK